MSSAASSPAVTDDRPQRAGIVLAVLIAGAFVANVNLGIANVALPDIGKELGATQVELTMVASMFTLGLAASVLYLGAVGDRYGRKKLLIAGSALAIPASLICAYAPNVEILIAGRLLGGIAAGLMFPTTLSLISALWRGPAQTRSIALWSGIGGGAAALGGLIGGAMLLQLWWGSVFLFTIPFAAIVLVVGWIVVPAKAGEDAGAVDHLGGILSVIAVACLVFGLQLLPLGLSPLLIGLLIVSVIAFVLFFFRQRIAPRPLMDLARAAHPTFWVAAVAGMVSFGSLIGALFLGQQFTQDVLSYSSFTAALVTIPCALMLMISAPFAGHALLRFGTRPVLASGIAVLVVAFLSMIVVWRQGASMPFVMISYGLCGLGVGIASTCGSRSLMASLPTSRAGMGSAFTDLTRDFGGAIMQALMGSVLAVVYANYLNRAFSELTPEQAANYSDEATKQILGSFEGAAEVAQNFPQARAEALIDAASTAYTHGKTTAYAIGVIMCLIALALVLWKYPRKDEEVAFMESIAEESAREREDLALADAQAITAPAPGTT